MKNKVDIIAEPNSNSNSNGGSSVVCGEGKGEGKGKGDDDEMQLLIDRIVMGVNLKSKNVDRPRVWCTCRTGVTRGTGRIIPTAIVPLRCDVHWMRDWHECKKFLFLGAPPSKLHLFRRVDLHLPVDWQKGPWITSLVVPAVFTIRNKPRPIFHPQCPYLPNTGTVFMRIFSTERQLNRDGSYLYWFRMENPAAAYTTKAMLAKRSYEFDTLFGSIHSRQLEALYQPDVPAEDYPPIL